MDLENNFKSFKYSKYGRLIFVKFSLNPKKNIQPTYYSCWTTDKFATILVAITIKDSKYNLSKYMYIHNLKVYLKFRSLLIELIEGWGVYRKTIHISLYNLLELYKYLCFKV